MSKIIAALVSGLFAVTVFAAEPAKKDAPAAAKPAAAAPAPAPAAAKPADAKPAAAPAAAAAKPAADAKK